MKKRMCAVFAAMAILAACNTNIADITIKPADSNIRAETGPTVGGETDAHGCIKAAGYTWSVLKNDCIRTFDVANVKLFPIKDTLSYTYTTNVVFNADTSMVEVYLPTEKNGVVLNRSGTAGNYVWKNDSLAMYAGNSYIIKLKGVVAYESR